MGRAVGMPADNDMGNSEVGHNAMGCGRVFAQGAKLVKNAIESACSFSRGIPGGGLPENVKQTGATLAFYWSYIRRQCALPLLIILRRCWKRAKDAGVSRDAGTWASGWPGCGGNQCAGLFYTAGEIHDGAFPTPVLMPDLLRAAAGCT